MDPTKEQTTEAPVKGTRYHHGSNRTTTQIQMKREIKGKPKDPAIFHLNQRQLLEAPSMTKETNMQQ